MIDEGNVALDVGPVREEPAGVGVYAASLARELALLIPDSVALIGVRPGVAPLEGISPTIQREPFRARNYHAWIQLHSARDARRVGATLIHYTNAAAPILTRIPYVVTVHDLSLVRMPRSHTLLRLATLPVMLTAVRAARAIITPSRWTARELSRALLVSPRRMTVIEHAPMPVQPADQEADLTTLARLSLRPFGYLLSVGTIEPRKNIERLVEAFERLGATDPEIKLVLAGGPGWHYGPILRRIEASPMRDRIVLPGYLPSSDVSALIRGCAAFCYVSTYEGFGMPVLEAMALGAAVVTSNRTAMPEAAGGAGVLVDPFDVAAIERGIRDAIARREELSAAGRARAQGRSWADVAAEHVEVYRWALRAGT